MPNKGKKSGSRQPKQTKKTRLKSTTEISRSFAKKDSNTALKTSSVNESTVGSDEAVQSIKVASAKSLSSNSAVAQLHPNINNELVRIFATTGIIIAIFIGVSFII